jgi:hypothetical protein
MSPVLLRETIRRWSSVRPARFIRVIFSAVVRHSSLPVTSRKYHDRGLECEGRASENAVRIKNSLVQKTALLWNQAPENER